MLNKMKMTEDLLFGILLCFQLSTVAATKCSYSFVVNQVDPSSCPCLVEQPSTVTSDSQVTSAPPSWQADLSNDDSDTVRKNQDFRDTEKRKTFLPTPTAEDDEKRKGFTLHKIEGGEQLKYEFNRLASNMKDLEIKVYQESVENRELKNKVIKQEQTIKDYRFLVERLKQSVTKHKISQIREKESLRSDITEMKRSVDILRETVQKQDFFLKTLEKNTHDLREHLKPSSVHTRAMMTGTSKTKIIPVQSTSQVTCDGLSRNATKYKGKMTLF